MINTKKSNGLPQAAFQTGSQKYRALAAGCVVLFGMMVEAKAVLLTGTLPVATSPTLVVQPGTVVGMLSNDYASLGTGGATPFYGTLQSFVVQRSGAAVIDGQLYNAGGLDFWVQVRMDFTAPPPQSDPSADNSRLTYSPFTLTQGGNISAEFLVGGSVPLGVPGFSGLPNGTQGPLTIQSQTGVIQWDWTGTVLDNSMTIANPDSRWLVLHTNDTAFIDTRASVIDGDIAPSRTFAPVPEPATALFGIAITGMLGLARRRTRAVA